MERLPEDFESSGCRLIRVRRGSVGGLAVDEEQSAYRNGNEQQDRQHGECHACSPGSKRSRVQAAPMLDPEELGSSPASVMEGKKISPLWKIHHDGIVCALRFIIFC